MRERKQGPGGRLTGISKAIASALETVIGLPAAVIVAVCVAALAVASIVVTGYSQFGAGAGTISVLSEFGSSGPVRQLLVPGLVAVSELLALVVIRKRIRRWDTQKVVIACLVAAALLQLFWTSGFMTDQYTFNDTMRVDAYARALNDHDMSAFVSIDDWEGPVTGDIPSYLLRVPYQSGMIWMFSLVYRVFGNGNYDAIRCLNMLANLVAVVSVIGIAAEASRDGDGRPDPMVTKMTAVFSAAFLPFLMSAPFVYSNAVSFALVALACWASAFAWARGTVATDCACMVASIVLVALAVMLKQTFMLFGLVLALCWLLHALRSARPVLLLAAVAMAWCCLHACDLPIWCLERATGIRLGDGQPIFANITLGLTWSPVNNAPGWYSPAAVDCYNSTDGSIAAQSAWCKGYIADRLGEFVADPGYALYFFRYKLASEWLDPSWQSCWFSACSIGSTAQNGLLTQACLNVEPENTLLVAVLDGMQTVFYALGAVGFASLVRPARERRLPVAHLLLVGTSLVGLLVYLLWEAQAMYTLPFAFLMLPMVARGCLVLYGILDARRQGEATGRNETQHVDV